MTADECLAVLAVCDDLRADPPAGIGDDIAAAPSDNANAVCEWRERVMEDAAHALYRLVSMETKADG